MRRVAILCFYGASALALAPAATAQDPAASDTAVIPVQPVRSAEEPADRPLQLDPITTTATLTARRGLDLPESVSQLGAEQVERSGASTLAEALSRLPAVDVSGGPRPGAGFLNIRGLGGTRVALRLDGARQNYDGAHRSNLLVDPDLLKSVDVLRGPASAIWGSDALGGVINMTTRDAADFLPPGERLGGRLKLGYEQAAGEHQRGLTLFGRVSGLDVLADTVLRDYGDLRQAGGQTLPYSAGHTGGGLYKLTQALGSAHQVSVSGQSYRQGGRSPSNPSKDTADDNPLLDRSNRQRGLNARYSYQAQAAESTLAAAVLTLYRNQLDVAEDRVGEPRHDELEFGTVGGAVHGSFDFPDLLSRLALGAESYRDRSSARRDGAARPQYPDARRQVQGLFVQNEIHGERWSLVPGLRYDRYRSESRQSAAAAIAESALSPKLGLSYEPLDGLTLTAAVATAFRAPSLLESFAEGTHFLGNEFRPNPDLKPERAANHELGLRLQGGGLALRLAVFDNRVRNYIETVVVVESSGPFPPALQCLPPAPAVGCVNRQDDGSADPTVPVLVHVGGYTTSENLPHARLRGGEAELGYQQDGYHFNLGYARLRGENSDSGAPLLSIAPARLSLDLGYDWSAGGLDLRTGLVATRAARQDRVPLLEDGTPAIARTPGYTVLDLYAQWQPLQRVRINLGVDNLRDQRYRRHLANDAEAGRSLRLATTWQF